jgi:hypothetical protein
MRTTGRLGHGRRSRLTRLTAGGALLAVVPLFCWACSSSSGPPGVQQACSDYGNKARPLIATVLAMDAKIRSGDSQGATEDANTIQSTLGGPPQQPVLSAGDASADQLALVIKVYGIWGSEWNWAKAELAGTIGPTDVDAFEVNLIGDAYLADRYAMGTTTAAAVCPSVSIASPYHP